MSPWTSYLPALWSMKPLLALPPTPSIPRATLESFPDFLKATVNAVVKDPKSLKDIYRAADPIRGALLGCTAVSAAVFVLGELTGNVSQVDRLWSFLPVLYTLHFTLYPLLSSSAPHPKELSDVPQFLLANLNHTQLLALATQLFWSARLTFNGARRGFFWPNTEDYRWVILRKRWPKGVFGRLAWTVFNFAFIAVIQNVLLLAIALPSYYLLLQSHGNVVPSSSGFSKKDLAAFHLPDSKPALGHWILAAAAIACVVGEYVADGQQQAYQSWKHTPAEKRPATESWSFLGGLGGRLRFTRQDLDRGFISTGLWSISRHPAFLLEQSFWWIQALFPLVPLVPHLRHSLTSLATAAAKFPSTALAQHDPVHYVGEAAKELPHYAAQVVRELPVHILAGAAGLTALFIGSTLLTEGISAAKYPLYRSSYQRRVGMFLPIDTYWKRVWHSVVRGNIWRRMREAELGWHESGRLKNE